MSLSQKWRRVKPGGSVEGFLWNSQEFSGIPQDFSVQNISKLAERETHGWSLGSHPEFGFPPWSHLGFGFLSQDPTWVWVPSLDPPLGLGSLGSPFGFGFPPWDPPLGFGVPFLGSLLGFGLLSQDPAWVWSSLFGIPTWVWSSFFRIPPWVWALSSSKEKLSLTQGWSL